MTQKPDFEIFDHTADIGLAAFGKSLEELFCHAGQGFTQIVTELKEVRATLVRTYSVRFESPTQALHQFLSQLIYWLDTESLIFSSFEFQFENSFFRVEAKGEVFNNQRHTFKTEVKAVTLHQLKVEEENGLLVARVILDL